MNARGVEHSVSNTPRGIQVLRTTVPWWFSGCGMRRGGAILGPYQNEDKEMTAKQFFDWQTEGGTDDVMRLVDCLERSDIAWCAIGGVAVNHWAEEPVVTRDVDLVVATDQVEKALPADVASQYQFAVGLDEDVGILF